MSRADFRRRRMPKLRGTQHDGASGVSQNSISRVSDRGRPRTGHNREDSTNAGTEVSASGHVTVGDYELRITSIHGDTLQFAPLNHRTDLRPRHAPRVQPATRCDLRGCDEEFEKAQSAIELGSVVEVYGPAGSGKSTLLAHLARRFDARQFPDGVLYLQVPGWSAEDVAQSIFDTFFVAHAPFKPSTEQLHDALRDKRVLVLLDDMELGADRLEWLMNAVPRAGFVVATTRKRLDDDVCSIGLRGLSQYIAAILLEKELRVVLPTEEIPAAQHLCELLDYQPQRIVQVAAVIREDELTISGTIDAVSAARNFEEFMVASLEKLADSHKQILGALASIDGAAVTAARLYSLTKLAGVRQTLVEFCIRGLPDEGITQVLMRYRQVLEELRRRGVVEVRGDHYRLCTNLKNAVREALSPEWPIQVIVDYCEFTEKHSRRPAELLGNVEELLRMLRYLVDIQQWADALSIARRLEGTLAISCRWDAWARVLDWALLAARKLEDRTAEAWVLHQQGVRAICVNQPRTAKKLLTSALDIRRSQGDAAGAAATRHNLNLMVDHPHRRGPDARKRSTHRQPQRARLATSVP